MTQSAKHLNDPRNLYPRPDLPAQNQAIPGQECELEPLFDHGEDSYTGSDKLAGRVALITGADNGIGRSIALSYAREGAHVAFTYRQEVTDAAETADLIREAGARVMAIKMDQSIRSACEDVIRQVLETFGHLDILINNPAHRQTCGELQELADDELERTLSTNIAGTIYFCRAALKHLPPGGSIINTTTVQALESSEHRTPYATSKAAIANFTVALAKEAIGKGVRVNGVAPGADTLFGRPALLTELAPVYVFLASQAASFITGEIYGVAGGT